jgi:hypothetical protein
MSVLLEILVGVILPLLCIVLTVLYLLKEALKSRLTPLKIALTFSFMNSLTITSIIFLLVMITYGISLKVIMITFSLFSINFIIIFPVSFYTSKYLLKKLFPKWFSPTEEINKQA